MIFDFLIVCAVDSDYDLDPVLCDLLAEVLGNSPYDLDETDAWHLIDIVHERHRNQPEGGGSASYLVTGFRLDLPYEDRIARLVVDTFSDILADLDEVCHVLKFEDPLLQIELAERAMEIFQLEMKLRRVLSLIYIDAYYDGGFFNLLRDEEVTLRGKPKAKEMEDANENQFFHLLFSDYAKLNQKKELRAPELLELISTSEEYDTFRSNTN